MSLSVSMIAAGGAPAAAAGGGSFITGILLPFGAMALIMYFLLIRPQQQQRKRHRAMLDDLKRGDTIVTSGGLIGKVTKLSEDEVRVDLGETQVRILRSMVVDVRGRGTVAAPANDSKAG